MIVNVINNLEQEIVFRQVVYLDFHQVQNRSFLGRGIPNSRIALRSNIRRELGKGKKEDGENHEDQIFAKAGERKGLSPNTGNLQEYLFKKHSPKNQMHNKTGEGPPIRSKTLRNFLLFPQNRHYASSRPRHI